MAFETKNNTGALWTEPTVRVDRTGVEREFYSGNAKVGGIDYWVSALITTTKTGKELYSLQFKPKPNYMQAEPTKQVNSYFEP